MTIETDVYELKDDESWKHIESASVGDKKRDDQHSERLGYSKGYQRKPRAILIVQNNFPCEKCHAFFLGAIISVIMKITADKSLYSGDHPFLKGIVGKPFPTPCIIYYFNGRCKYVTMFTYTDNDAPEGFPHHSDVADI